MGTDCTNSIGVESYEDIFNSLGTGVIYYDHNGCLLNSNKMAGKIFPDLRCQLPTFQKLINFVFEHSLDMSEQTGLSSVTDSFKEQDSFFEMIKIENSFYMIRAVSQGNQNMIVEISDITRIKASADNIRALDRDNRLLANVLQTTPKAVFICGDDEDRRIVFVNNSVKTLLGRERLTLLGQRIDEFLKPYFPDEWNRISVCFKNHKEGKFWQRNHLPNGDVQWFHVSLTPDTDNDGRKMIIGFISDDTINKATEHHMMQAQKMDAIGKLASGVAHDFNNILSIIDGYVRLSERAIRRGENISENFQRIKKAVARGSGLTRQLLMFGKHRVGEDKIIDLNSEVRDVESFLEPLLGADFTVHIDAPVRPILIHASTDSIYQIIMNLVINARDAMNGVGKVNISISEEIVNEEPRAILKISDTGCGIPQDIIEKIFDPFFTTKEQGKGTGLGLSMVYGIVKQVGGEIAVTSTLGEGTSFTMDFPAVNAADKIENDNELTKFKANITGKTILIAEDEDELLLFISEALAGQGMKVLSAKNGRAALEMQAGYKGKIDFLLTDIVMPEMTGAQLAGEMKTLRPDTRILFMSGYPAQDEIADIDLPDDIIFMAKPVQFDFLCKVLSQICEGKYTNQTDTAAWQR